MALLHLWLTAGLLLVVLMTATWLLSLVLRDSSIVDVLWGPAFVACCWTWFVLTPEGWLPRKVLLAILVTAWGLRLAVHIFLRNHGKGEDPRYAAWREQAGTSWWWRSFFTVFVLQGVLVWLIATPLLAAQAPAEPSSWAWLRWVGAGAWLVGFVFEAGGDWQLARFKAEPANRGQLLTSGLWRYTRHPNYFGDALQWWGFWLIAASAGTPFALATVLAPILMTVLLLKVSGVALLEKGMKKTKPGYEEYVARTNAFVPWVPRER